MASRIDRPASWMSLLILLSVPWVSLVAQPKETVVRGGWVFDTARASFLPNQQILIRGTKILSVNQSTPRSDSKLIQFDDDDYILPGIVDLHAHYNVRLFRIRRDELEVNPVVYLANGTTTTFPAGEYDPDAMRELRLRIEKREQIGPRLLNSGPYFGSARRGWRRDTTAEEVHQQVDHWVKQGVAGFKAKGIGATALKALIDRAHYHGLTVTAHLDSGYRGSVNPRDAILMGIDRIEHFLGGELLPPTRSAYSSLVNVTPTSEGFDEIVKLYIDHGTYFDATLTAYGYFGSRMEGYDYWVDERHFFTPYVQQRVSERPGRRIIDQFEKIYWVKRKTIKAYFDAGGLITLGTDHFSNGEYLPGFSAHRELEAFVLAGIPASEAIKIATINGARAIKRDDDLGSIEPGKEADMLVVKGNPIEDIKNTRSVHTVIKAGEIYRTDDLLSSVKGKLGPSNDEQARVW